MASIQQERNLKKQKAMCDSKVGHRSMLSAEYALDGLKRTPNSGKLVIYTCPICGLLHIGKNNKKKKDEHIKQTLHHNSSVSTFNVGDNDLPMEE